MSWANCLNYLKDEIPQQEFQTWISPLQFVEKNDSIILFAPNPWVANYVENKYSDQIKNFLNKSLSIKVGSFQENPHNNTSDIIKYNNQNTNMG